MKKTIPVTFLPVDVAFKDCAVHPMIRFTGEKCPMCQAVEDFDLRLGVLEHEKTQLEGEIDDLQNQIDTSGLATL